MNKLSVTTAGVLAGSTALLLLGMALERAKSLDPRRSPIDAGDTTKPVPDEGPETAANTQAAASTSKADEAAGADDNRPAGPWPFPTAEGNGPH